jgi:hypothetical protein
MSTKLTHRQAAALPARVVGVIELRQGNRAQPIPGRRRQDPRTRGGRQGVRTQLRRGSWD